MTQVPDEVARVVAHVTGRLGVAGLEPVPEPRIEELTLAPPRLSPPDSLAGICSTDIYDRAAHTYGKSYADYARALARDFSPAPDVVAFPANESDVVDLLDWADGAGAAVIPFGAGSRDGGWRRDGRRCPAGG